MCGIFGWVGANPRHFNRLAFNVLGLYNDSRGKDACGLFLNNKVYYGADKEKLFETCIKEKYFPEDINKTNVVFGHCRKASVGGIHIDKAQPVVVYEEENPVFVMLHNGTLLNYKELADKYEVPYENGETDSQIFARVVYKAGYKVLAEYTGAGAFAFYDLKQNIVRFYKGLSKTYSTSVTEPVEERPLCFIHDEKHKMLYFSSMADSLHFIKKDELVYTFTANTLYVVQNGEIIDRVLIERKHMHQQEYANNAARTGLYNGNVNKKIETNEFFYIATMEEENDIETKGYVCFHKGRYYLDGALCHGTLTLSYAGEKNDFATYRFSFWQGRLLHNNSYFTALNEMPENERTQEVIEALLYLDDPFYDDVKEKWYTFKTDENSVEKVQYEGTFTPLFSDKEYTIMPNDQGVIRVNAKHKKTIDFRGEFFNNCKTF